MPWEFWSDKGGMRVHPGNLSEAKFYVRNPTDRVMVGQAVPSVVPLTATDYFHKTECFCFNQQPLEGESSAEMPLQFIVDRELPADIRTITLSYTIFDVTAMVGGSVAAR